MIARIELFVYRIADTFVVRLSQFDSNPHPARKDTYLPPKLAARYGWSLRDLHEDADLREIILALGRNTKNP